MGHTDSPASPPNSVAAVPTGPIQVDESLAGAHGSAKIMIVDDEPINIGVTRKYMKMAGYTNFTVTTEATEAMEIIRRELPDVLLLDIVMPRVSGLEILGQLRADPALMRLPVIILTVMSDLDTKHHALLSGATDFLNKPLDFTELVARVRNVLMVKAYYDYLAHHAQDLECQIQERTAELATSRLEVIQCLARAAECRTDLTKLHSTRVSAYAGVVARGLGLDDQAVESLELAALLHDVGKIGFSDAVLGHAGRFTQEESDLLQKHGALRRPSRPHVSQEESAAYKLHTLAGSRIMAVGKSRILELAATIAMSHHEKWDGTGYPFGLSGENIPLESRIVAVANVFDLLSTKQCHRPAFSEDECFAIIADGSGTHFDPAVLEAFERTRPEILQIKARHFGTHDAAKSAETSDPSVSGVIPAVDGSDPAGTVDPVASAPAV